MARGKEGGTVGGKEEREGGVETKGGEKEREGGKKWKRERDMDKVKC